MVEQPLQHVLLEIVLLFHDLLGFLTHLRSVFKFGLLLPLLQHTHGLSLLGKDLIESLVDGG